MKKLFVLAAFFLGLGMAAPQQACAHDGYIYVKNKKTGQAHVYELAYDGWVYRVGTMSSGQETRGRPGISSTIEPDVYGYDPFLNAIERNVLVKKERLLVVGNRFFPIFR